MRTTKGAARTRAKRKLFKRAKGYRGGRRNMIRSVKETLIRAGVYAYRDRKTRKRNFRRLWIIRVNAACRQRGIRYSQFIAGLKAANIELDRKSLSEIAICDPAGFDTIVDAAKGALASQVEAGGLLR
jgi:large subunit ribosomal protein L20